MRNSVPESGWPIDGGIVRVSEALARVDAQREKLARQLSELEATERVLARYSKGTRAGKAGCQGKDPIIETRGTAPARWFCGDPALAPA